MGIVSSIGFGQAETLDAILNSKSGIGPIQYLDTLHRGHLLVGEVKASNEELSNRLNLEESGNYTRTTMFGIAAARAAYQQAGLSENPNLKTGIISSTSVGGIDQSEIFYGEYLKDSNSGKLRSVITHDCGDSTEKIADDLNIKDHLSTISTACSSAANAMMLGARLIKHGHLDRVLVGGTDALTKYTLNGFNSLKILDAELCRPFDESRAGLNLGEGAGFLVLESERAVNLSKKEPLAELAGYGNANDAYHQTASSPEGIGAFNAMNLALKTSRLSPNEIDYINAHGTATPNNDQSEGTAFKRLFGDKIPPFSSTKSLTGHTLAAAGALEAVFSILALQHQVLMPNLNFKTPIEGLEINPVTSLQKGANLKNILSNSFGFGGNCSAVVFSKINNF